MIITGLFVLATVVVGGAVLSAFWNEIANWLNTTVTDTIEKYLGYGARNKFQKAIVKVEEVADKLRKTATVYTKEDLNDVYVDKTEIVSEIGREEVSQDVWKEIDKEGRKVVQEFSCKKTYNLYN